MFPFPATETSVTTIAQIIQLAVAPVFLLAGIGVALWSASGFAGAILVILGVIGFAISALISQALSGIFGVALYRYAAEGQAVGGFTPDDMESAVRRKKGASPAPATV